jgi:hypothetical protein
LNEVKNLVRLNKILRYAQDDKYYYYPGVMLNLSKHAGKCYRSPFDKGDRPFFLQLLSLTTKQLELYNKTLALLLP